MNLGLVNKKAKKTEDNAEVSLALVLNCRCHPDGCVHNRSAFVMFNPSGGVLAFGVNNRTDQAVTVNRQDLVNIHRMLEHVLKNEPLPDDIKAQMGGNHVKPVVQLPLPGMARDGR